MYISQLLSSYISRGMELKGQIIFYLVFLGVLIGIVSFHGAKKSSLRSQRQINALDRGKITSASNFITLDWAKMRKNELKDIFTFISAYSDERVDVPDRPAVVVLTYIKEMVPRPELRCLYKYSNGSKLCVSNVIAKVETVDCFATIYQRRLASFKFVLCPLQPTIGDIPQIIQLSSSSKCEEESLSSEIIVRNNRRTENTTKKIGVCLHSSLRDNGKNIKQRVRNFISMCRFLGADFITMFASPDQVSPALIGDLLTNYSNVVNLVEWKALDFDYYGQFGIIHECLFRHMHEVEYLALIDLDEMIIPKMHLNWPNMLDDLEKKGGGKYAGYSFLNRMYKRSDLQYKELYKCAKIDKGSIYLSWLDERKCIFRHSVRSKLILSPKHSVHACVHRICTFSGNKKLYLVKKEFAISAHYRKKNLGSCWNSFSTNKMSPHLYELLDKYTNSTCYG